MANVTYPQMIAAFKTWYGQNKTRPSPTVEIDGQPAVRKASFGEMVQAGLTQLATEAAAGGFEFLKGGPEGLNKFLETLPKEIAEPAKKLAETAGEAVNSFKGTVDGLIPEGGNLSAFKGAFEDTLKSINNNFINPLGDTFSGVRDALSGDASKLAGLQALYANDSSLSGLFGQGVTKLGTIVTGAVDGAKAWTDELTLGTGDVSLGDIFGVVNNSSTEFMAKYLGIGEVPSLTGLIGTIAKPELVDNLLQTKKKEEAAELNLRKAAALKFPTVPDEFGSLTLPNPEISALGLDTLPQAEKDAILANFNNYVVEFDEALSEVEAAGIALKQQVQTDQKNVLITMQASSVVDSYGSVANTLLSVTDPAQRAILESTIKPSVRDVSTSLVPVLERAQNPIISGTPTVDPAAG